MGLAHLSECLRCMRAFEEESSLQDRDTARAFAFSRIGILE